MENPTLTADQIKTLGGFSPEQVASYNRFRATGFDPVKSISLVIQPTPTRGQQTGATNAEQDNVFVGNKSLLSSIIEGGKQVGGGFKNVYNDTQKYGAGQALLQAPIRVGAGVSRGVGTAFAGALETADDLTGEIVSGVTMPALQKGLENETAQDVIGYLDRVNQENRGLPADILEIITAVAGTKALSAPLRGAITETKGVIRGAGGSLSDFLRPVVKQADEVIETATRSTKGATETATSAIREAAEESAPTLNLGERAIGLTPDVKGRLQEAGEDLTRQYIDIAKTRNVTDTIVDASGNRVPAPTPYGFAAQRAERAADELQRLASETGSVIGRTRERLSTYRASPDQITNIENKLVSEIQKMNLAIREGEVVRARGIQTASEGDIKAVQTIYDNLKVVKESQKLPDLIEFRSAVDENIKFGKRASEVSNAIDPLSRALRSEVATVAAKVVGPTEASELAKYSDFMDALADLRSYTDRKAGGEYLLRLVSSGRGDEARRLVNTIREYTGIDLMNDATLMAKVTDLIGNDAQKNLFRQEISKAQLDAQAILSGSPVTLGARAIERGIDWITDAEKILINAARKNADNVPSGFPVSTPAMKGNSFLNNRQGGYISLGNSADAFINEGELTTKVLSKLDGRTTVSKQFISDLTNSPDLKQAERDLIRNILNEYPEGNVQVKEFAEKVKTELLPLKRVDAGQTSSRGNTYYQYEGVALPDELRGPVANYSEHIYESPIRTSAGRRHGFNTHYYYGHSRIEDLPNTKLRDEIVSASKNKPMTDAQKKAWDESNNGDTRRVIEIQSDLFQKGRLEGEELPGGLSSFKILDDVTGEVKYVETGKGKMTLDQYEKEVATRKTELSKLEPYRNTWQDRIIREEVKQAAIDGKTKLQFPTGETAMKIEGLGDNVRWYEVVDDVPTQLDQRLLKVGKEIENGADREKWIITKVLENGKFKAVPNDRFWDYSGYLPNPEKATFKQVLKEYEAQGGRFTETFDVSGKIDTENPIYRFYEKEVGRYLKNKYKAELITDPQGVTWWEVTVDPKLGDLPVDAFGKITPNPLFIGAGVTAGAVGARQIMSE